MIDSVIRELAPMRERAQRYLEDPAVVRNIIADGCDRARELAGETSKAAWQSIISSAGFLPKPMRLPHTPW